MPGFTYHCFPGFGDRYLAPESFEAILPEIQELASASKVGESVSGRPIYGLKLGRGTIRILMWSQMHGNESTTTRALLDLLLASGRDEEIQQLFEAFTLYLIPILNPDGAAAYTRNNANDVDLNRDAHRHVPSPRSKPYSLCLTVLSPIIASIYTTNAPAMV